MCCGVGWLCCVGPAGLEEVLFEVFQFLDGFAGRFFCRDDFAGGDGLLPEHVVAGLFSHACGEIQLGGQILPDRDAGVAWRNKAH